MFGCGRASSIALSAALIAVTACNGGDAPGASSALGREMVFSPAASVEENGTVDWPASTTGKVYLLTAPQFEVAPVIRPSASVIIGSGKGGEADELGAVHGIAVDAVDRIYVWDTNSFRIRVYSPAGSFIRDIGRQGGGPGEFFQPTGTFALTPLSGIAVSNDTVFALDRKLQAFDTAGNFIRASDGALPIYNTNSITATPRGLVGVFGDGDTYRFLTVTFEHETIVDSFTVQQHFFEYGDDMHGATLPHSLLPYHIASTGHIYFAVGDSLHVDVRNQSGHLLATYVSDQPRVEVSEDDKKDFIRSNIADMRRLTPGYSDARFENEVAASLRRRLQYRPFAKYRQAISSIIASESGSMLLARPDLSQHPYRFDDSSVMRVWTLIDAGSNVVAHIQLPNSYVPKVFRKCALYGILYAEDGTELVAKYDIGVETC